MLDSEDFYIDLSKKVPHFVQVARNSVAGAHGLPAIGEYVKDLLKQDGLELVEKERIEYRNPPRHELRNETPEALDRLP